MRFPAALIAIVMSTSPVLASGASVSGTDGTNALGTIPCSAGSGAPIRDCHAELRRKDDGSATLAVILPGGETRRIYFTDGVPTSSSSPSPISSSVQGETMEIFIEPGEVFRIPARAVASQ